MLISRSHAVRLVILIFILFTASFAAEPRRVSIYAPQTTFQADILVRDGTDYLGLLDLLEPLGKLDSRVAGKKLTVNFNGAEAEFQDGSRQYRARGGFFQLPANFLLVDGRGYIPVAGAAQVLPRLNDVAAEYHPESRRLFVGPTRVRFNAELRHDPTRLVLHFPSAVNPTVNNEGSRVRLVFRREPVVSSGTDHVAYNDGFVSSTAFTEANGAAEFIANVRQPASVSLSDGNRTVTIASNQQGGTPPPPAAAQQAAQAPATPAAPDAQSRVATSRVKPFVIIDAAHGGFDTGAVFSSTLLEKDVNLSLARRLHRELDSRGIPAVMTRITDNVLTWDQRAVSANTSRSTLYVSIHSAAEGHGIHIYTSLLPPTAAAQSPHSFLPWEAAQSPFLNISNTAASGIAAELGYHDFQVHTSAAAVRPLNSVTTAAIAIEVCPTGDSTDEFATAAFQQKVVNAIASGIVALRGKLENAQ